MLAKAEIVCNAASNLGLNRPEYGHFCQFSSRGGGNRIILSDLGQIDDAFDTLLTVSGYPVPLFISMLPAVCFMETHFWNRTKWLRLMDSGAFANKEGNLSPSFSLK